MDVKKAIRNYWEVREGLTFVAIGKGKQVYRVANVRGNVVTLERLGSQKGFVQFKRENVPGIIGQILEVPNAGCNY